MIKDYGHYNLLPNGGELYYIPNFLDNAHELMDAVLQEVSWRNDKISMFGKTMEQPRKVAWYGDKGISYTYSGIQMVTQQWTPTLNSLKNDIAKKTGYHFNSVLLNLYRNGEDYMSWHSDDEKELGENPVIASLSLGVARDFFIRSKQDKKCKVKLLLESGSLLMMQGQIQKNWQHMLPKRKKIHEARLNLTFRNILTSS